MAEQRRPDGGSVRAADYDLDVGLLLFDERGEVDGVQETRGCGGKSDQLGFCGEDGGDVSFDPDRCDWPEAVVHRGWMSMTFQPSHQRQYPDRCHTVCQHREVGLPGDKIEPGRVDEGDAHGQVALLSRCDVVPRARKQVVQPCPPLSRRVLSLLPRHLRGAGVFYVSELAAAKTLV